MINLICKCILDEKAFVRTLWYTLSNALLDQWKYLMWNYFHEKAEVDLQIG